MKTSAWILGDQLIFDHPALSEASPLVLMVESWGRAEKLPWHWKKLVFVWSAMRHFADELRARGRTVDYYEQQEGLREALRRHLRRYRPDRVILMATAEYGRAESLAAVVREVGAEAQVVPNTMFLSDRERFAAWAEERRAIRMEPFYRHMRQRLDLLMEDGEPVGGTWNYDAQNREQPTGEASFPSIPAFEPDAVTRSVMDRVCGRSGLFGAAEPFEWPVTHQDAERFFADFLDRRLDRFGPYEDAMIAGERALCHSLISPLLNVGLLDPLTVCRRAEAEYEKGQARLNSVEGFIRQIIGWRELIYQVYHRHMPSYLASNYFEADMPLPEFYWTGETAMRCLSLAVNAVRDRAINHHIQRLMVTGNFALLLGVDPQAVNRWYLSAYIDAYEWVVTPNVLGLSLFADGGIIATKPYAASANYIHKMSDYCETCEYDHRRAVGDRACPFNALYWDFLARNEPRLREVPRMGLMLSLLKRKDAEDLEAIRSRAADLRTRIRSGERV